MEIEEYLIKMRKIQKAILEFIESVDERETKFNDLIELVNDMKIRENCDDLKLLLHLIMVITRNHNRNQDFFSCIERILLYFKDDILKYYFNWEIFSIFKRNNKILLFLINSKMLTIDHYVKKRMKKAEHFYFFYPEMKKFLNESQIAKISPKIPEDNEKKRQIGENESYICGLIRNDSVQEFVSYVNKNNISLSKTTIPQSIFDTNNSINWRINLSLIEYAAFFGAIQIFKHLLFNKIELTPSLWWLVIHGKNDEIVRILIDNHIEPFSYLGLFNEAIICHHNDMANYFKNNYLFDQSYTNSLKSLESYNFEFIQKDMINNLSFIDLCKHDYITLVKMLLQNGNIDINAKKKIYKQTIQ